MCGISGFLTISKQNYNFDKILKKISNPLIRRGPDNYGYWSDGSIIGLAHQRLSIIDLSSVSNQPMISKTKKFVISYNGEIYNYLDLKNELLKNCVKFFTNSDTEVLINACEYWGIEKA